MKVTENDFQYMLDCQERDIATLLVKEYNMTIHQALDVLYQSDTYRALKNPDTGLFFQSPIYVMSYLRDEIDNGKF